MKTKAETIKILKEGGRIMVDTIYRKAEVCSAGAEDWETVRFDVAERLQHTPGFKKVKSDWYATYFIEAEAAEAEKTAAEWAAESESVEAATLAALAPVIAAEETAAAAAPEAVTETEAEERAPEYLNEKWPASNSAPGVKYIIKYRDHVACILYKTFTTVDDLQTALQQIKNNGGRILGASRIDENAKKTRDYIREFIPETRQEQTDRENREYCKRIAEDIEAYAEGRVYRCPDCGAIVEDNQLFCECGAQVDLINGEWEQQNLYDYFSDCLDIEYRCGSDREYRSCSVMVACGGPNIYIDTARRAVLLYWWTDRAEYPLSSDAVDAVDEWAEEYWNCL